MSAGEATPLPPAAWRKSHFHLRTGPFVAHVRTSFPEVATGIRLLYGASQFVEDPDFVDFHVSVEPPRSLRRWFGPQSLFFFDGHMPFKPMPRGHALPLFEWGLNWSITSHVNQFLIIHAAVIEKGGRAAIMPGNPGAGKSTLCAGLVNRGWRLLSDELAMISLADGSVRGLARPVSLKNESIGVIRQFAPDAVFSPEARDTAKGTVALLRAPGDSIARMDEPARPAWIIFPKYVNGLPAVLSRRSRAGSCLELAKSAFNYSIHGALGFDVVTRVVAGCNCYRFSYADLNEAVEVFAALEPPA